MLAHFIHRISKRKSKPFLTINCAAIPEELLESELFGYSKRCIYRCEQNWKTRID
ncbi:sigma 54-interacting transcriptional regulator [Peribacillus frigoritolerans]|nr:sigma 54-interacting transcriptional regulator [Peribacillus frigoritolerans]